MSKLILSLDGVVIRDVKLDKERISIGRKPQNDVIIDNLAVSGEHTLITCIGNDVFAEDLGSTNGTIVNGEAIKKQQLHDNDMLEIGKYKLKFVVEKFARPPEDFEKTMMIRRPLSGQPAASAATPVPPVAPAASQAAAEQVAHATKLGTVGYLQILTGSNVGKELELTKNVTNIGKTGEQVAVVSRRPQGYFITHVIGPKHPIVNGVEIDARARALNDHDVIELAGIKMEFFYRPI